MKAVTDLSSAGRDREIRFYEVWKGICRWVLLWVVDVQEYDMASAHNEDVWREVHASEAGDVL